MAFDNEPSGLVQIYYYRTIRPWGAILALFQNQVVLMTTRVFSVEEGSEYVLERLHEAADATLYRGAERSNATPILAVVAERPSPQTLARLEHEFSLAGELDAAWAVQPLTLRQREGRAFLILKDPGVNCWIG